MPKTKIICTLGPATDRPGVMAAMILAGMDVVRLNFSHGAMDEHARRIDVVRSLNKKMRTNIRILGDLEGFRIRVGHLRGGRPVEVKKGQSVWLVSLPFAGHGAVIPFDFSGPLNKIRPGQSVFIDDGRIALCVEKQKSHGLFTRVVVGGVIRERKGINLPDVSLGFQELTEADKDHTRFAAQHGLEYLAQSFVRSGEDVEALKTETARFRYKCRIIAKIENREGIRNVDSIVRACEGVMVARGDMGVSLPIYEVPLIQKKIILKCNRAKKFAITATQMLESMVENRIPTRAEVSDIANAILDGTDYVMLSAETAVGQNPVACVDIMNKIIVFTEKNRLK